MQPRSAPPTDILQLTTTVAALVAALAALTLNEGPIVRGVRVVPAILLLSGLPALLATLYATVEVMWEAGIDRRSLLRLGPDPSAAQRNTPYTHEALVWTAWSLALLGVAYIVLFFTTAD